MKRIAAFVVLLAGLGLIALAIMRWASDARNSEPAGEHLMPRRARSVLLITVDTTRADYLEPYGSETVKTPSLQRLADTGVLFERAYSVAPITLVAHTTMLTGLYPPEHGVRNNGTHYVPDGLVTLSELLQGDGYRTAAFVSAAVLEARYGLGQGFEVYDDDLSSGRSRQPRMVADRPAEAVVENVTSWLDGLAADERFFVWAHLYDPHASYSPPPPFRDDYRENLYAGEIAYMDHQIGRLLEHPRLASSEDLVVTVIGDHGESLGQHGEQTHALLAYDSTLHVPWITRVSGGPAGKRVRAPVDQSDLMPTMLDLLDMEPAADVAGKSLLPLMEGQPLERRTARSRYAETYLPFYTYGWAKLKVLRRGDWKYVDAPTPELFDLRRDPFELSNLYDQEPDVAHDLARDLREFLDTAGEPEHETTIDLDSEAAESLRALGYLAVGTPEDSDRERGDPKELVHLHVGLERARGLMRDRLYDAASNELRAILDRDPQNLAAMVDLATALEGAGRPEEAVVVVEEAMALDPDYPRLYLTMAGLQSRLGDPTEALALVDMALELDPRSLEAKAQKVQHLRFARRFDEARATLDELMTEYPGHPRVLLLDAQAQIRSSDFERAKTQIVAALERDPFLVAAWRLLGDIEERSGRFEAAEEAWRSGLERQPDDVEQHARLGLLLARRGGGAEAERHLREAIRLAPSSRSELHVALGAWLAEQGRFEEAEEQYQTVLDQNPTDAGARNNLAIAHYRRGRIDEAVVLLESVVEEFPQHPDAYNNLAALAVERSNWSDAERYSRAALELDRGLPMAWNNLGIALEEQGRFELAGEAYDQALALDGEYWQASFNRAVLARKEGRSQAAAQAFEALIARVPGYPDTYLELGRLYAGPLDDAKRAKLHLNAFLRRAPRHSEAAAVRRELAGLPAGG